MQALVQMKPILSGLTSTVLFVFLLLICIALVLMSTNQLQTDPCTCNFSGWPHGSNRGNTSLYCNCCVKESTHALQGLA